MKSGMKRKREKRIIIDYKLERCIKSFGNKISWCEFEKIREKDIKRKKEDGIERGLCEMLDGRMLTINFNGRLLWVNIMKLNKVLKKFIIYMKKDLVAEELKLGLVSVWVNKNDRKICVLCDLGWLLVREFKLNNYISDNNNMKNLQKLIEVIMII